MKSLPNDSIDLTVTSPPYDDLRNYNGYTFDFETVSQELFRVTKQGGVVVWIVNDGTVDGSETGTSFRQALHFKEIGFNLHDTMIWFKRVVPTPQNTRYYPSFEYMFVFSKGKPQTVNLLIDRQNIAIGKKTQKGHMSTDGEFQNKGSFRVAEKSARFNVWEQPPVRFGEAIGHPAQFPIQLAQDHILTWSNVGDVVLDPFIGSGSTAIACVRTGRHYIGFDISEKYIAMANARIAKENIPLIQF